MKKLLLLSTILIFLATATDSVCMQERIRNNQGIQKAFESLEPPRSKPEKPPLGSKTETSSLWEYKEQVIVISLIGSIIIGLAITYKAYQLYSGKQKASMRNKPQDPT